MDAVYQSGEKPEIIQTCDNSFDEIKRMISLIVQKISQLPAPESNNEIIDSCNQMIENISSYHDSIVSSIGGLDLKPVVDMSMLGSINQKLEQIIQLVMTKENSDWSFEVERDMTDKIIRVKAHKVIH